MAMASSRTTGRFSMVPTPRIATCGWLMIGVPKRLPNDAGVGDREGAALDLVDLELLGARALGQVVHRAGEAEDVLLVGVVDHGHDQAPVERHRHADVDVLLVDDRVAVDAGVQDRERLQRVDRGLHDERAGRSA